MSRRKQADQQDAFEPFPPLKPDFVSVDRHPSERNMLTLTIGRHTVECNGLTGLRLYELLRQQFGMWGDKPNRADCREIREKIVKDSEVPF